MAVPNLTRDDARVRAELLYVESYDVDLDLTDGADGPSERTFRSVTTVEFTANRPGASTFIDVIADKIHSVTLNGKPVDVDSYEPESGIVLADLARDNVLVVDADLLYTNTGEGLHRFVDPADNEVYLYSQFETADAKRMYVCFDQPDLKATFTLHVLAPQHWKAISNGRVERVEEDVTGARRTHFATTKRISPYITALIAGPYHSVHDEHDGIDLGIYCRASLAEFLDPEELFTVTKQGFDWFHANFGMRYPFDKYDQLFVPEFNAGAMENAAAVTIRDEYVYRGKVTDARRERRGETILHEMAHMWFGDLVTMRWFDDLWLNESFATWAAVTSQAVATRWPDAWTTFANVEKTWAYRQDQLPSTHPVVSDAPDVQTAEVNFDGITYAKGASVLKQLVYYVGQEEFLAGVRQYFADHAYGNTTLADLLRPLEQTSGRNLGDWAKLWLEATGINAIRPEFTLDEAGHFATFELVQSAPNEVATTNVLRPHRLAVGLYNEHDGTLIRTGRVELDVTGERTHVEQLIGVPQPDLLLVNDDDLTYCKLRLDERSLRTLREGGIARLASSLPRALAWSAAWDMTRDGEMATRDYIELVLNGADAETDIGLLQSLHRQSLRALEVYADPEWAPAGYQALAEKSLAELRSAEPGSDHQLAWAHAFVGAARSDEHTQVIKAILNGDEVIEGLVLDAELRWALLQALVARGAAGEAEIAAEHARDNTSTGLNHATTARALIPTQEAKAETWRRAIEDDSLSNRLQEALITGFAPAVQGALVAGYMPHYFEAIPEVWRRRSSEVAQYVVIGLFPSWGATISPETVAEADRFLADSAHPPALRRLVSEGRADVLRALRAREVDRAAARAR